MTQMDYSRNYRGSWGKGAKDLLEIGVASLTGAAIGAGVMFLLDPDSGQRRRRQMARATQSAIASTGEVLSSAASGVGQRARDFGGYLGDRFSSAAETAGEYANDLGEQVPSGWRVWDRWTAPESGTRSARQAAGR